jgi:hypothetical protein
VFQGDLFEVRQPTNEFVAMICGQLESRKKLFEEGAGSGTEGG